MPIVWEGCKNILRSDAQTLIVPVNMVGVAGKGLAEQFKLRYPGWYASYSEDCRTRKIRTDGYAIWRESDDRIIYSLPTKNHWRDKSPLHLINTSLMKLAAVYKVEGLSSIAIPAIGCGEGKLSWDDDVYPLITQILEPLDAEIGIFLPFNPMVGAT